MRHRVRVNGVFHHVVDTDTTFEEIRRECGDWFSFDVCRKSNKYTVHRGFLFNTHTFVDFRRKEHKHVVMYLFDAERRELVYVHGTWWDRREMREWVDNLLAQPDAVEELLSPAERLYKLDLKFGRNKGAAKERARLQSLMQAIS